LGDEIHKLGQVSSNHIQKIHLFNSGIASYLLPQLVGMFGWRLLSQHKVMLPITRKKGFSFIGSLVIMLSMINSTVSGFGQSRGIMIRIRKRPSVGHLKLTCYRTCWTYSIVSDRLRPSNVFFKSSYQYSRSSYLQLFEPRSRLLSLKSNSLEIKDHLTNIATDDARDLPFFENSPEASLEHDYHLHTKTALPKEICDKNLQSNKCDRSREVHINNTGPKSHSIDATKPLSDMDIESEQISNQSSSLFTSTVSNEHYQNIANIQLPEGKCVIVRLSKPEEKDRSNYPHAEQIFHGQLTNNFHHWMHSVLHPDEIKYGTKLSSYVARNNFFLGRLAIRTALQQIQIECSSFKNRDTRESQRQNNQWNMPLPKVTEDHPSILKDKHGRPHVPPGYLGSISHKRLTGVSLVSLDPNCDIDNNSHMDNSSGIIKDSSIPLRRGIGVDIEQTFSKRKNIARKVLTKGELANLGNIKGVTSEEEVLLRFR